MDVLFYSVKEKWGKFDILIYCLVFVDKFGLMGNYIDIFKEVFS